MECGVPLHCHCFSVNHTDHFFGSNLFKKYSYCVGENPAKNANRNVQWKCFINHLAWNDARLVNLLLKSIGHYFYLTFYFISINWPKIDINVWFLFSCLYECLQDSNSRCHSNWSGYVKEKVINPLSQHVKFFCRVKLIWISEIYKNIQCPPIPPTKNWYLNSVS